MCPVVSSTPGELTTLSRSKHGLSLRERRKVTLTVRTTLQERPLYAYRKFVTKYTPVLPPTPNSVSSGWLSDEEDYDFELVDSDEDTESHFKTTSSSLVEICPTRPFVPRQSSSEKSHLDLVEDDLYVAYADDANEAAALRTFANHHFTHILQITAVPPRSSSVVGVAGGYPSAGGWSEELTWSGRELRKLHVAVPALPQATEKYMLLSPRQLLAARDWIALAMPLKEHEIPVLPRWFSTTRLVVVAPRGRKADIMAVVIAYLAFAQDRHVLSVAKDLTKKVGLDEEWMLTLSATAAPLLEMVARLW
ncbi:hypothetical protein EDC04DRAFT_706460 [Pisolithus marmoratus]|nr:hypothetical protein EDC04DRAFT_706460 [Pisolithus marmoratus]